MVKVCEGVEDVHDALTASIAARLERWQPTPRQLFGIHCLVSKEPSVFPAATHLEGCLEPEPVPTIYRTGAESAGRMATFQVREQVISSGS